MKKLEQVKEELIEHLEALNLQLESLISDARQEK